MEEKKIATSIDVLINVSQFEHIQITKYAEKKIAYSSQEDMVEKEDNLTSELVNDIIRTMRSLPDRLGKKTEAIKNIEEKIQKKIPSWLEENPVPNIANLAKDKYERNISNANAKIEQKKPIAKELEKQVKDIIDPKTEETPIKTAKNESIDLDKKDLFDDEDLFK